MSTSSQNDDPHRPLCQPRDIFEELFEDNVIFDGKIGQTQELPLSMARLYLPGHDWTSHCTAYI